MFKRSRRRIALAIAMSLLVLMAVILSTVYIYNYADNEKVNSERLEKYAENYDLNGTGQQFQSEEGSGRPPGKEDAGFFTTVFYAVAFSPEGEVLKVENGRNAFQSPEELVEKARTILSSGSEKGKDSYLMYRVKEKQGYTLVVFMNITNSRGAMTRLLKVMVVTGLAAFAVVCAIAPATAKRIIKPLEENDQRQKQFISDAGHELKTPVAVMSTNVELLERAQGKSEWLDNIRYENEKMGTLVRQLLDLSRAESAGPVRERIELGRLIEGEALPFESVAFESGKSLVTDLEEGIFVEGDRQGLCRVVSVLLDNAIDHSSEGSEIRLSLRREHRSAVLSVSNEGEDIPEEKLEHIFERFYRTQEARTDEGGHYGLGLAIARAVAESHHGNIEVTSKNGRITFTVTLPASGK